MLLLVFTPEDLKYWHKNNLYKLLSRNLIPTRGSEWNVKRWRLDTFPSDSCYINLWINTLVWLNIQMSILFWENSRSFQSYNGHLLLSSPLQYYSTNTNVLPSFNLSSLPWMSDHRKTSDANTHPTTPTPTPHFPSLLLTDHETLYILSHKSLRLVPFLLDLLLFLTKFLG